MDYKQMSVGSFKPEPTKPTDTPPTVNVEPPTEPLETKVEEPQQPTEPVEPTDEPKEAPTDEVKEIDLKAEIKKDPFSPKFAALSKREKEARAREEALAEREAKIKEIEEAIANAENDPDAFLAKGNLDYEKLTKIYLNGKKPPEDNKLKLLESQLNELKEGITKKEQEKTQQEQQQALADFHQRIDNVVEAKGEQFELIKLFNWTPQVHQVMVEHYQKTEAEKGQGEVLSIEDACKYVESHLEKEVERLTSASKKIKGKLIPNQTSSEEEPPKQESAVASPPKTLNHSQFADRPVSVTTRAKSRDESLAELAKRLKFNA